MANLPATPSRGVRFLLVLMPAMMAALVALWSLSSWRDRNERDKAVAAARTAEAALVQSRTDAEKSGGEARQSRLEQKHAQDEAVEQKRVADNLAVTLAALRASDPGAAANVELRKQAQALTQERDAARADAARQRALADQEARRAAEAELTAQRAREEAQRLAKEKEAGKPVPAEADQALRRAEVERQKLADEVAVLQARLRVLEADLPQRPRDPVVGPPPPVAPPVPAVAQGPAWRAHPAAVRSLTVSADGRRLATTGGGVTRVWDAANGELLHEWKGHEGVLQVAFNGDGRQLAALGSDGLARICDTDTGLEIRTLRWHGGGDGALSFRPGTTRLLTGGADRNLRLFEVGSGQEVLALREDSPIRAVSFSADGHWLAIGKDSGEVAFAEMDNQGEPHIVQAHGQAVRAVTFSADARQLATGGADGSVQLWDTEGGRKGLALRGHTGPVTTLAFNRDGGRVAAAGGNQVRVWDTLSGKELFKLDARTDGVSGVAFDAEGRRLFVGQGNAVRVFEVEPAAK